MATKQERRTVSINEKRVIKIDKAVNTINRIKDGKAIIWTDIVNHLIDEYLDEATQDIIHSQKK